jgi:hypothetical protein
MVSRPLIHCQVFLERAVLCLESTCRPAAALGWSSATCWCCWRKAPHPGPTCGASTSLKHATPESVSGRGDCSGYRCVLSRTCQCLPLKTRPGHPAHKLRLLNNGFFVACAAVEVDLWLYKLAVSRSRLRRARLLLIHSSRAAEMVREWTLKWWPISWDVSDSEHWQGSN